MPTKRSKTLDEPLELQPTDTKEKVKNVSGEMPSKKRGNLQLKDLVDGHVLTPGRNKVAVHYKGTTYKASLGKDGSIIYQGRKFQAASAFSVHVKRLLTPNKQGDDGWKSVYIEGRPLEEWREEYFQAQQQKEEESEKPARNRKTKTEKSKPQEPALEQEHHEVATDQWVQCSRCENWRLVPHQFWQEVTKDTREEWFCEDAEWDLRNYEPYTEACSK